MPFKSYRQFEMLILLGRQIPEKLLSSEPSQSNLKRWANRVQFLSVPLVDQSRSTAFPKMNELISTSVFWDCDVNLIFLPVELSSARRNEKFRSGQQN